MPSGDGDEGNSLGGVTDLLDVAGDFLLDFLVAGLRERGSSRVHLVDGDDQLLHTEGEGEEGVFAGLSILGDTSLELTDTGSDDKNGAVSL